MHRCMLYSCQNFLSFNSSLKLRKEFLKQTKIVQWPLISDQLFETGAFAGFMKLKEIIIPSAISQIGAYCFKRCLSLKSVKFEAGGQLKTVGDGAFISTKIVSIAFPKYVESIGKRCFAKCECLKHVSFEENSHLKIIQCGCFMECTKLASVEFGMGVGIARKETISTLTSNPKMTIKIVDAVHAKADLEDLVSPVSDTCYVPRRGCVVFSNEIDSSPRNCFRHSEALKFAMFEPFSCLREISNSVCMGSSLVDVMIPRSVEVLCDNCFAETPNLVRVTFEHESYLKRLGTRAFYHSGLKLIEIPASVEVIGNECFMHCEALEMIMFNHRCSLKVIGASAMSKCDRLEEIVIPRSVEDICEACFSLCSSLCRVTFASGCVVKRLRLGTFEKCDSLKMIEIPASVEEIEDDCFYGTPLRSIAFAKPSVLRRIGKVINGSIVEIVIPASVEEIGSSCFRACFSLLCVKFERGSSLTKLGNLGFAGCANLREIDVPASVETIGEDCFRNCRALSSVRFASESVLKYISNSVFNDCKSLLEIEIPASVEEIGDNCFWNCRELSRVTFVEGSVLKRIGRNIFFGCPLNEFEFPAGVERIGGGLFAGCHLARVNFKGQNDMFSIYDVFVVGNKPARLVATFQLLMEVKIPVHIEEIGAECFKHCMTLSDVTFPSGCRVRIIGNGAFSYCNNIQKIEIPESVDEIGDECFKGCVSLFSVTFAGKSALKRIGVDAFYGCNCLKQIRIPESVEQTDIRVFPDNCNVTYDGQHRLIPLVTQNNGTRIVGIARNVYSVNIPARVVEIADESFYNSQLKSVTFANGSCLKQIGKKVFRGCEDLKRIDIPASVEEIGEECFAFSRLSCITFSDRSRLKIIGKSAFHFCVGLKEIHIPASVEELCDSCFSCSYKYKGPFKSFLSRVTFSDNSRLKHIGDHVFSCCDSLKEIEIPASVEVIGIGCFSSSPLICITFAPGSVLKRIENEAFCETQLQEIHIPASVEFIGEKCFAKSFLTSVAFADNSCLKHIGKDAFQSCTKLKEITVPVSTEVDEVGVDVYRR